MIGAPDDAGRAMPNQTDPLAEMEACSGGGLGDYHGSTIRSVCKSCVRSRRGLGTRKSCAARIVKGVNSAALNAGSSAR